jgi:hypothetical protein
MESIRSTSLEQGTVRSTYLLSVPKEYKEKEPVKGRSGVARAWVVGILVRKRNDTLND